MDLQNFSKKYNLSVNDLKVVLIEYGAMKNGDFSEDFYDKGIVSNKYTIRKPKTLEKLLNEYKDKLLDCYKSRAKGLYSSQKMLLKSKILKSKPLLNFINGNS